MKIFFSLSKFNNFNYYKANQLKIKNAFLFHTFISKALKSLSSSNSTKSRVRVNFATLSFFFSEAYQSRKCAVSQSQGRAFFLILFFFFFFFFQPLSRLEGRTRANARLCALHCKSVYGRTHTQYALCKALQRLLYAIHDVYIST